MDCKIPASDSHNLKENKQIDTFLDFASEEKQIWNLCGRINLKPVQFRAANPPYLSALNVRSQKYGEGFDKYTLAVLPL